MIMDKWNRNIEGYADSTAGIAIEKVSREERKSNMTKSSRNIMNEKIIHEKAEKMRRMTDEQLVHYVENRIAKAKSEGFHNGKAQILKDKAINIQHIIGEIGDVRGIGISKLTNIQEILKKHLEAYTNG